MLNIYYCSDSGEFKADKCHGTCTAEVHEVVPVPYPGEAIAELMNAIGLTHDALDDGKGANAMELLRGAYFTVGMRDIGG